tara:strand:+ start:13914 stop:16187 length:2274 start_codon:yes stop_codon:yes gene_type:complete
MLSRVAVLTINSGPIPLNTRLIDDRGAHIKQELPSGLLSNPPVRLCLTCNLDDIDLKPCSRDHLQRRSSTAAESENKDVAKSKKHGSGLRGAVKRTVKDALLPNRAEQVFQRKLSDDEDKDFIRKREVGDSTKRFSYVMKAGAELERIVENSATFAALSSAMGAGGNAAAAIMSPSSGFNVIQSTIKSLRNRVTPAGTYHTSLRFGTITIESGVGKLRIAGQDFKANRGILVSPRFSPALLADKKDASVLLFAPSDRLELEKDNRVIVFGTCCNIYATQNQNGRYRRRRVRLTRRPIEERNGLACMKIVYGAAFSSYPDSRQSAEETTIETLVQEAVSYHKMLSRSKTTQSQHQALFEAAERVLESLQSALKSEVDKYLNRLVDVFLDPETDLSHNALSNNCQRLVDKLLQGKDFEYFFPRLPKQPISCDNPITNIAWPQYLMSFSDRIDGQSISLQQPNSVMTQYFSRTRFGGDVVDFMTSEVRAADGSGKYDALLLSPGSMKDRDSRTTAFNAMWEMPRDTLSILQFHLSREKPRYASGTGGVFTQGDWIENRLLLLLLVDIFGSLSGGLGASLFNLAASDSDLVKKIVLPKARVLGSARVGEKVRILQLPGKQIVYFIASKAEEQLKEIFQAPENDVALFSTMLHQCFHKVLRVYTKNVSQVVTKVLRRIMGKRPAKRGFTTVSRLYGTDFLSLAVHQAIQLYETRKRDGWFHLDFGDLIIVLQLFRKSKTVRENISTMERELVTGSQEDEQGV